MLIAFSHFFSFVLFSPSPRRERHRSKSPRRHRSRSRDRRHRSKSPGTLDITLLHHKVAAQTTPAELCLNPQLKLHHELHNSDCVLSWSVMMVFGSQSKCSNTLFLWTRSPQKPQTSQPLQDSGEVSVFIHISTNNVVYFLMAVPLNMFLIDIM